MATSASLTQTPLVLSGIGLITGLEVTASIEAAPQGQGIEFELPDSGSRIPARLARAVHTDRGVTLADPATGKTLSIVEHFLAACAMAGLSDLTVRVTGGPELPLLDGSAEVWRHTLSQHFGTQPPRPSIELPQALFHRHSEQACLFALPADTFQITYTLDYPEHPDVACQWARWQWPTEPVTAISPARTFGFMSELPALQASGLAKGVRLDNTLGLSETGGYSTPLRLEEEPLRHKMLDLLGDLMLMGVNPLSLKAHLFALNAGHGTHVAFGKRLQKLLLATPSA
jgi:UDP-3-O-[3-hydroxymyristoyl] N-acetylglucosamine deacetylase